MAFKIIWTKQASVDLREIVSFIAQHNHPVAESFGFRLMAKVDLLAQFPQPGRIVPEENDDNIFDRMADAPEISVLMPTYNYASYLPEAIESVLAQDFTDFELLIVDDCSADNTADVVKLFAARGPRVRFAVNPANLGMVANWNHCLNAARGRHIKFLFGDDKLADPKALSKLLGLLRDNPSATLAASARAILDERSKVKGVWQPLAEGCHEGRKVIAQCLRENANLIGEPSAVLFRKSDCRQNFDIRLRQIVDLEMWFQLLEKGNLAYAREPLCAFRQHARQQSAVNDNEGRAWREHLLFFGGYAVRPGIPQRARFSALFNLRRSRRKNPASFDRDLQKTEQALARQLGEGWYWVHWLRRRLTRPFYNLKRAL